MDEKITKAPEGENQQQDSPAAEKKKKNSPEKIIAIVLASLAGLLLLLALAAGGFVLYTGSLRPSMFQERPTQEMQKVREQVVQASTPTPSPPPLGEIVDADWIDEEGKPWNRKESVLTVLLMGIDYMKDRVQWDTGRKNGGNADVIVLLIVDLDTKQITILNIPRDTMTDILALDADGNFESMIYANISSSHSFGDGKALSCELVEHAVSSLLCGVKIDRYVAVDYDSVDRINELLGGLEFDLDRDYTWLGHDWTAGKHFRLNNYQLRRLLQYRDVHDINGAYDRSQRDLKIMKAMFEQFKRLFLEDPGVVLRMYSAMESYVTTDFSMDEISFLAQTLVTISPDMNCVVSLPGENRVGEKYVEYYPDLDWISSFSKQTFYVPCE
ncbi:MAG: LCP family protein [Lachnospiraceae bacterium]|nr:LCP family protein [Lachnospiraceae bacterium]